MMVSSGYRKSGTEVIELTAMETFRKGVRDRSALNIALNRNPITLDELYQFMLEATHNSIFMLEATHNSKVALGACKPIVRRIDSAEEGDTDDCDIRQINKAESARIGDKGCTGDEDGVA